MRRIYQGFDDQLTCLGCGWLLSLLVGAWGGTPVTAQPFAYVTQPAASTVAVINTAINSVVATIPVASPNRIAVTPDGAFAYVTQPGSNTVAVLELATHHLIATIPVAVGPPARAFVGEIAVTPNGARAYVTSGVLSDDTVTVINTATNTVVATIPVGKWPIGVVISPDSAFVYVVNSTFHRISW